MAWTPNLTGGPETWGNPKDAGMYWNSPDSLAMMADPEVAGRAGDAANAFTSHAMPSLSGLFGGGGGDVGIGNTLMPGGATAGGSGVVGGGQNVPGVGPIDNSAANSAAFGHAKDQAGQMGRSGLDSLRGLLGESGMMGGGAEGQGTRDVVTSAMGQMGDVSRANAAKTSDQALDVAKTNQASAITQRGQDIASQEANARLAQEQAQLASQRQLEMLQMALSAMPKTSFSY